MTNELSIIPRVTMSKADIERRQRPSTRLERAQEACETCPVGLKCSSLPGSINCEAHLKDLALRTVERK